MPRLYLHVALPVPLRKTFDYSLPASFTQQPAVGSRVLVPFGQREMVGIVLSVSEETDSPPEKIKAARQLLDEHALFPSYMMQLLTWAAQYYQHPIGDVFSSALPTLLRQGEALYDNLSHWRLTPAAEGLSATQVSRSSKQQHAWKALEMHHHHGISEDFLLHLGIRRDTLLALRKKGWAEEFGQLQRKIEKPSLHYAESPLVANPHQQQAINAISQHLGAFKVFLLDGVTGSGKTEVYLQTIASCLANHQQALILVPEIGLTPQTVARFRARFAVDIVMLHSGLTERERLRAWRRAYLGQAAIVIGTRSTVFTPMPNLGLVIVDEEHDLSFKQQDGFRYHARDLAILRAQFSHCPVVLGSATPSLESIANAKTGRYQLLALQQRAISHQETPVKLIDLRGQKLKDGLSPALQEAIQQRLHAKEQVLIFLNRRGFAPVLMCHDCGWQAKCPRCDARTTLHRQPLRLHCHHCGFSQLPPKHCPDCHKEQLFAVGAGTVRIEEALQQLFPHTPIHRIDRDSTRRKDSWHELYQAIDSDKAAILVGTQMLAKGHHFPNVTLVALLEADSGLFGADFRASERVAQLITQVAGRAGRAHKAGLVLLQTHQPEHPLLQQLLQTGYQGFVDLALAERQALALPPYGYLALLRAEANYPETALEFLSSAVSCGMNLPDCPEFWGPIPAPLAKKAGIFRAHLLIKSPQRPVLQRFLSIWLGKIAELPDIKRVRWSIDVDPQELS
ncbi:primosomal protein N' [Agitococcus lubricus]|uniref:Replication restart protein PriA n=1 Tax=Agitococcus lubricus TaxID=1077255 RepID=A0A2T5IWE0_9GAMM|nr:primosomal protein N' [Agitococcus lubricus]PTQ88205.1 replication restart DNA helicase PriA [Agitococcus lubricus]